MVSLITCAIIWVVLNYEIMGCHVFLLGIQALLLSILLLYSDLEISEIDHNEGRFCICPSSYPKIERCKLDQNY